MSNLGPIDATRCSGYESFRNGERELGFDPMGFWQWSASDLVGNATRGVLAEFLVAQGLGDAGGVKEEWAAHDLTAADGTRVEVKTASYIQKGAMCHSLTMWDEKDNLSIWRFPASPARPRALRGRTGVPVRWKL